MKTASVPLPWWENTDTWTTREKETLALEEMSSEHRTHVIAWMKRRPIVSRIRARMISSVLFSDEAISFAAFESSYDGDFCLTDPTDAILDRLTHASDEDLIEGTPLVKRLRELNALPCGCWV